MEPRVSRHHVRKAIFVLVIAVLLAVLVSYGMSPLMQVLGKTLIVRERPAKSDAIIVLSGGRRFDRPQLAAQLYQKGFASKVLLCEESAQKRWAGFAGSIWIRSGQFYRAHLLRSGVRAEDIEVLNCRHAKDTAEELVAFRAYAGTHSYREVLLVTSAAHSRRVRLIWQRVGLGMKARTIGAPDPSIEGPKGSRKRNFRVVTYEFGALCKELFAHLVWKVREISRGKAHIAQQ